MNKVKIRFEKKFKKSKGCWNWHACTHKTGYGRFMIDGNVRNAHRVSLLIYKKIDAGNLYVLHKCDNKKCVNPKHLFVGSQLDNMRDASAKGLMSGRKNKRDYQTHCKRGHLLGGKNIRIYIRPSTNTEVRICRSCEKMKVRNS